MAILNIIKKWGTLFSTAIFPLIFFILAIMLTGDLTLSIILGIIVAGALIIMANLILLNNPMMKLLDGAGIAVFDMDSSGIIQPFFFKKILPYVEGDIRNQQITDAYNRKQINYIKPPIEVGKTGGIKQTANGDLLFKIPREDILKAKFSFSGYPVFIWNSVLKTFLDKELLSKFETTLFAEHQILHLNRRIEDTNNILRNFARYVMEQIKPKKNIFTSWWFLVMVAIIIIIVMIALLQPIIAQVLSGGISLPSAPDVPAVQAR